MKIALTREVSRSIRRCELSFQDRVPIDLEQARAQHQAYLQCLASLGCRPVHLAEEPELPDSVFVEDTAVVLDEVAVITRPGALARRQETAAVAETLRPYRPLIHIMDPGTLDGGDVLRMGKTLFIGMSQRTNETALRQMSDALRRFGYTVRGIPVIHCLHLKSAVTQVSENTLLINRDWIDADGFGAVDFIDVDPKEPCGANALLIDDTVIFPSQFPKTRFRLERSGVRVLAVDSSELAKAEGGVTCCSLVFNSEVEVF